MARFSTVCGMIATCALGGTCAAQVVDVTLDSATMDRWNYPFNGSPGTRLSASTFGAVELDGFDDRDAQFIVGFDLDGLIESGLDASEYEILSVRVTVSNTNGDEFRYDPTYDTHDTYAFFDETNDLDPGRPISLWGVGYRNDWTQETWGEYSVFGGLAAVDPAQGARHAFACDFPMGVALPRDVSNNLKEEFDPTPLAIGQVDTVAPGDFVPADSDFVFDVELCDSAVRDYVAGGVSLGEVRFVVTSLSTANGGKGGGTGDVQYPFWYTRENPIAQILGLAPRLEIRVRVGDASDYNGDGVRDIFDVLAFLEDFNAGGAEADLMRDCVLDIFDVVGFLNAFNS